MRYRPLFACVFVLALLCSAHSVRGEDLAASRGLRAIVPPGGVPLQIREPGSQKISVDLLEKVRQRMQAVPEEGLKLWVAEVERLMGQKFEGELAQPAFHTYLATHLTLAFDDLRWNANSADRLFGRAQTMPAGEAVAWRQAFEKALKKEIGQTADTVLSGGPGYAVPLVLIPIDGLYDGQNYNVERGKRYLARLSQLIPEDVALWKTQVDAYGGTELDAAANLVLLDDYFAKEKFQREKLTADLKAKR